MPRIALTIPNACSQLSPVAAGAGMVFQASRNHLLMRNAGIAPSSDSRATGISARAETDTP
jgi:hypothetical protein